MAEKVQLSDAFAVSGQQRLGLDPQQKNGQDKNDGPGRTQDRQDQIQKHAQAGRPRPIAADLETVLFEETQKIRRSRVRGDDRHSSESGSPVRIRVATVGPLKEGNGGQDGLDPITETNDLPGKRFRGIPAARKGDQGKGTRAAVVSETGGNPLPGANPKL